MAITPEDFEATMSGEEELINPPFEPVDPAKEEPTIPPAAEVVTPPAADTPPAAAPQTNFNIDEELVKITGGSIKSKDELATLLEKTKGFPELETRLKTFEQENASLKAKTEVNPFANDFTKKLNDLVSAGANESKIQAFMLINKVDIDGMEPMAASSLALQIKHGLTAEEANNYLNNKYGVDVSDPDFKLDSTALVQLKIDSAADRDFLKTHKAEVSATPENEAEKQQAFIQQQQSERIQQLAPIAKTIINEVPVNSFKGVSINGKDGDGANKIDLPLSEESKNALAETVNNMVTNNWNGLQPNEKGIQDIKTFSENVLVLQNWKNWLVEAASQREAQVRAEYHNPSSGNIARGQDNPNTGKTSKQEQEQNIMETLEL